MTQVGFQIITQQGSVRYGTVQAAYKYGVFGVPFSTTGGLTVQLEPTSITTTKHAVTKIVAGSFVLAGSPGTYYCRWLARGSQ